ncbi:hypothetical protein AB0N05_27460 [Nocardia sp. NPDC051030]|uniref:DUF7373 family lipoprotein n=1 Tax=Nocardia sp. NPDC051030 TaxID=3155162 RepID=UPI00343D5449
MNLRLLGKRTAVALLIATATLATACTVPGDPMPQHLNPAALRTGIYTAEPLDAPPGTDAYGRVLEAVRLSEAMIDPIEADSALTAQLELGGLFLMPTPVKAATLLAEPVRAVLERRGMITGAAVGGADRTMVRHPTTGTFRALTLMVFRFPDTASAQAAASEIDATDAAVSTENVAVTIPDYPAAHAHWRPNVPTLAATMASGTSVISLLAAHTAIDLPALTALAHNGFDKQERRLRDYQPTPADTLATLPLDPDKMLSRMVPTAPGRWPYPEVITFANEVIAGWDSSLYASGVVLGPRASQLFGGRVTGRVPAEARAINNLNSLFRFPTAAAARAAFERQTGKDKENGLTTMPLPDGIAAQDMHCTLSTAQTDKLGLSKYLCVIRYGRYLAAVFSRDATNVLEKASAQYGLLVGGGS